jgi:Cu2+-exporting ATPase
MFGAAAMSLSSFCVVTNALRLNLFDMYSAKRDKKIKNKTKEVKPMTKTMKIEGMMCGHCEARVKKTLEKIEGVAEAQVSHTAGTAVLTLSAPVADDVLKKAIEDQDYTVLGIE